MNRDDEIEPYPPCPDCNSTVAFLADLDGEMSIVEVTHDGTCPALLREIGERPHPWHGPA